MYVGGDVEVAEYHTTGTQDLADAIAKHVATKGAVLMANHGLFAVGRDPKHALHVAQLVERTAEIVWGARLLGEIVPLPDDVSEAVLRLVPLRSQRRSVTTERRYDFASSAKNESWNPRLPTVVASSS